MTNSRYTRVDRIVYLDQRRHFLTQWGSWHKSRVYGKVSCTHAPTSVVHFQSGFPYIDTFLSVLKMLYEFGWFTGFLNIEIIKACKKIYAYSQWCVLCRLLKYPGDYMQITPPTYDRSDSEANHWATSDHMPSCVFLNKPPFVKLGKTLFLLTLTWTEGYSALCHRIMLGGNCETALRHLCYLISRCCQLKWIHLL